jgi:8-oxo-dGTP diphosphatase
MSKFKNEAEAIDNYDASKYRTPDGYTADIAVFTIESQEDNRRKGNKVLKLMLIRRAELDGEGEPNIEGGKWALPGGFIQPDETAYKAAKRELEEETGVKNIHIKHFGVYDMPGRDKRGWIISAAHYAIVPQNYLLNRRAADDAAEVRLFSIDEIQQLELAFDHYVVIQDAIKKIRKDMLQTTVAKEFLPKEFTVSELKDVILAVCYHKSIDSENFFKKVDKLPFIEAVKNKDNSFKTTTRNSKRPAKLYRFIEEAPIPSVYY